MVLEWPPRPQSLEASRRLPFDPMRHQTFRLACALLVAAGLAASAPADLAADVQAAIKAAGLKDATIAVSVRDADSDAELVAVQADRPMIPASNMKLLTSGTALHLLGPDFRFRTRLVLVRERAGSGAGGTLVIVGDGDPGFADPDLLASTTWVGKDGTVHRGMSSDQLVALWVDAVKAAGVTSLREVVVDDRIFAREFFHPAWPVDQLNQRSFAEVAGLNFQTNLIGLLPRPGNGPRPEFELRPRAPWISIENKATAGTGKKDKQDVWFSRVANANTFTARGNVKFASTDPIEVPLHDAPSFMAALMAHRLRAAGIEVGSARVASSQDPQFIDPRDGTVRGELLAPTVETPFEQVLARCNTDSQNVHAEALLKRAGHVATKQPGSWTSGAEAVRRTIADRLGDPQLAAGLKVSDGSGLSKENRVTARLLTAWLNSFHADSRLSAPFVDSLAVGGESGTIRNRFGKLATAGVTVQCKTGFVNGVSCLSGYVTMPDGRRRSFSVLGNNLVQAGAVAKAKKLQEAIVEAVAEDMRGTVVGGG